MGYQTITRESEIRRRLKEIEEEKTKLGKEYKELNKELENEVVKNRKRRPSRFL